MAVGWSAAEANAALDELANPTTGHTWVQLHVGDPGAAGTTSVATENTRMQATFNVAAAGSKTTSANLNWLDVPAVEDFTHFSVHDAATLGNFGFSGTITANAVGIGDDFVIAAGDFTISVDVAA